VPDHAAWWLAILAPSMSGRLTVTFRGVRGSTPCAGPAYARYGGHSSCVSLEAEGEPPIMFDLGTGARPYGLELGGPVAASVLLTHLHWDHVQGLPFFTPLFHPESSLDVYAPRQAGGPVGEVFEGMMRPPYFPITPAGLAAQIDFHDAGDDEFPLGQAKVRSRWVRHVGPTLGFRVEWHGASVAYISDHGQGCGEAPSDDYVPDSVLELCDGVDLLIHDAQHTPEEFEPKRHWGHCTIDYAVHVAREAGVRALALFHHDPAHGDDDLDLLTRQAEDLSATWGLPHLFSAAEGQSVVLGRTGA
jgi:phosphoribosyl 1,2-cyclic phosphodiesterase